MKMRFSISLFILLSTLLNVLNAHSETITFNDVAPANLFPIGSGLPYEQAGYKIVDRTGGLFAFIPPNGVSVLGFDSTVYGPASDSVFLGFTDTGSGISIGRWDGQSFALNGLDVGISSFATSGYITFNGQKEDSSTFNYQFAIADGLWHTISLSDNLDFGTISSVFITGSAGGSIAIDNIRVSQVPIPAAMWMLGTGLIGLTKLSSKRKHIVKVLS